MSRRSYTHRPDWLWASVAVVLVTVWILPLALLAYALYVEVTS